jgi:hypothetical protein
VRWPFLVGEFLEVLGERLAVVLGGAQVHQLIDARSLAGTIGGFGKRPELGERVGTDLGQ